MATHEQMEGEEYLAMLDHVRCEGDEENLLACRYISKIGNSGDCTKVAGVICGKYDLFPFFLQNHKKINLHYGLILSY